MNPILWFILWLPWAAFTIAKEAVVRMLNYIGFLFTSVRAHVDSEPLPKKKVEWSISGFSALLKAVEEGKRTGKKATVTGPADGKLYVVEVYEVRDNADGTISRIIEGAEK